MLHGGSWVLPRVKPPIPDQQAEDQRTEADADAQQGASGPAEATHTTSQQPAGGAGRKWELTCVRPWVAKEKMGTLLLASEMPVPIPRNR